MKLKIPSFRDVSVLVIGDVMLDRYWYGKAGRVSQEAPVPIVDIESSEDRPGGAANVAMNLASLGLNVTLIGVVGDDEAAVTLRHKLAAANVRCDLIDAEGWPTILKVRVISRRQQMLRIDFEKPIVADVESRLDDAFRKQISAADVVVIEDYDKGTLVRPQRYIDIAHEHGKRVVVDPKFKPFEAYRGADVIKPNIAEFTHAVGGWADYSELVSKAAALVQAHDFGALVVTRGDEGMSVIERNGAHHHVPARPVDVFDETGAGDTVAATLAAGLAAGCTVHESAMLANAAAGLVVTKSGTATVSAPELRRELKVEGHADRGTQSGTLSREELIEAVEQARREGERVVFTNGCFDILHAGHVAYLEEASALGDRLIVAVNDDASVARLKGEGRPVNGVAQRMRVLGALASVDWTVSFGEDTPEALLEAIKPDVLVKGGDYRIGEVVGADIVRRYGGEVRVLAHVPNLSTSAILESLKRTGN
jgi:D-beta-D-heptose 7-phosphate kinase / D-beta-D-heptose 1-phosphate adenosyltransferase